MSLIKMAGTSDAPAPSQQTTEAPVTGQQTEAPATNNDGHDEPQPKQDFAVKRPDYVPEKFWDKDKNEVRMPDVFNSYTELERKVSKLSEKPKAPDKYEYKPNEKLVKEHGVKEEIPMDDPYLVSFSEFAKTEGLSQEQYSKFVDFYISTELKVTNEYLKSEMGKLGDEKTAISRIKNIQAFSKNKLSEKSQRTLESMVNSAEGVALVEELINISTKQRNLPEGGKIAESLTQSEIDAIMMSDAYNDKKHPEFKKLRDKVTAFYEAQGK